MNRTPETRALHLPPFGIPYRRVIVARLSWLPYPQRTGAVPPLEGLVARAVVVACFGTL